MQLFPINIKPRGSKSKCERGCEGAGGRGGEECTRSAQGACKSMREGWTWVFVLVHNVSKIFYSDLLRMSLMFDSIIAKNCESE